MITIGDRNRSRGRIKKLYIISNNKQSKYIFFLGGRGVVVNKELLFSMSRGNQRLQK